MILHREKYEHTELIYIINLLENLFIFFYLKYII